MILQVISTSPYDSRQIQQSGCQRIQLVSALEIGGLTPPSSILRKCLQQVSIPTNVLLRHHNNGFVYNHQEKQLLLQDVRQCRDMKAAGIVIGGLNNDKSIDQNFLKDIILQVGGKMTVTFHKAFDQSVNFTKNLDILENYKIDTVLTQGGTQPIIENYETLSKLINYNSVKILLGGGINHQNIGQIIHKLKPSQIHIGTCVRSGKYGPVNQKLLNDFINILK